jgi:hypothetical protein
MDCGLVLLFGLFGGLGGCVLVLLLRRRACKIGAWGIICGIEDGGGVLGRKEAF